MSSLYFLLDYLLVIFFFPVVLVMDLKSVLFDVWDPITTHFLKPIHFCVVSSCTWRNVQNIRMGGIKINGSYL